MPAPPRCVGQSVQAGNGQFLILVILGIVVISFCLAGEVYFEKVEIIGTTTEMMMDMVSNTDGISLQSRCRQP